MKNPLSRFITVIIMTLLLMSGCGSDRSAVTEQSSEPSYSGASDSAEMTGDGSENKDGIDADGGNEITDNRKLIRRASLTIESTEFQKSINHINGLVSAHGGYIQNSQIYGNRYGSQDNRSAYIVVRIPDTKLSLFLDGAEDLGNIISRSESTEDVTAQYTDTQAKLTSLKTEFDRLLVLIDRAEKLEDIIRLEERLSQVRYQMDSVTAQLKMLDNEVDFSTVSLEIYEVRLFTSSEENDILQRIKTGFMESILSLSSMIQNLIVAVISNIPYIFVAGIIAVPALYLFRRVSTSIPVKKLKKHGKSDGNNKSSENNNDQK